MWNHRWRRTLGFEECMATLKQLSYTALYQVLLCGLCVRNYIKYPHRCLCIPNTSWMCGLVYVGLCKARHHGESMCQQP